MTTRGRRWTTPTGQLHDRIDPELRGRDASGLLIVWLDELQALIDSIHAPTWVTGRTVSALHHFDGYQLAPPFQLLMERGHNVTRAGHVIHTTTDLPLIDREHIGGMAVVSPTRALLSIAATDSAARVTAALDGALRDGKTTEDFLHRRIGELRRSGRPGISPLLAVMAGAEVTRGGHSWLEREFLRLMAAARLPRPGTQRVLGRRKDAFIRVDFRWPDTPVVVEVLGYGSHRTRQQLMVDTERMNRLQLLGFQVLQFTYPHVVDDPDEVVAMVVAALTPHLGHPAPSPRATA